MNETANSEGTKTSNSEDTKTSNSEGTKTSSQPAGWPWPAQLFLALVALGTACFLLIWIPMQFVSGAATESGDDPLPLYSMIAVFIGLTTMTVSGMFLFMTFRIDRGTKATAREEAGRIARETLNLDEAKLKTFKELEKAIQKFNALLEGAIKKFNEAKSRAIKDLEGTKEKAIRTVETAGDEAAAEVVRKGNSVRDRIEGIEKEERARIETVGTEARERIAGETRERVDRMVESAHRKIDEADIETLVNEKLARSGRLFRRLSRRREPRP